MTDAGADPAEGRHVGRAMGYLKFVPLGVMLDAGAVSCGGETSGTGDGLYHPVNSFFYLFSGYDEAVMRYFHRHTRLSPHGGP